MAIPEFYKFIRPTLELANGKVVNTGDIEEATAKMFQLNEEDRTELLSSGRKTRLRDRIQWAMSYLRQAQLVESAGRGLIRITPRGRDYLRIAPSVIKPADLLCFPEFVAFQQRSKGGSSDDLQLTTRKSADALAPSEKATPEEVINFAYKELRNALAEEILDRIKVMPPAFFEALIVKLMLHLGYGRSVEDAGQTLGKSGDGGVDGVISQDKLGLDKIYLQAKRWNDASVGSKEVQAFVGALVGQGVNKGVFITTSAFSDAALKYRDKNPGFKISLIDGYELARLMIDHDLGVSPVQRYDIKRIDSDFFSEE